MFTRVHLCLPLFNRDCLPMLSHLYLCLPMLTLMVYNSFHKGRGLTFRKAFTRLTEIRSLMPPDIGIIALSTRATRALRLQVEQMLGMR